MANRTADTTRHLSEIEAAWLGALIEGEGSIICRKGIPTTIELSSTEIETVATCLRLVQAGMVEYRPLEQFSVRALVKRLQWRWRLRGIENIRAVLRAVFVFLTGKQELALACLSAPLPRLGTPEKTQCLLGHFYAVVSGRKVCRTCQRAATRRYRARRRAA